MITVRRLEKIFAWFLLGGLIGAMIGALGGMLDRGSMMILMPSGSAFWAIVGAFFGSIVGALYGAFSKLPPQHSHFINPEETSEGSQTRDEQ